ncbi:hypothetical protein HKD37_01G001335 [Glycine soja]
MGHVPLLAKFYGIFNCNCSNDASLFFQIRNDEALVISTNPCALMKHYYLHPSTFDDQEYSSDLTELASQLSFILQQKNPSGSVEVSIMLLTCRSMIFNPINVFIFLSFRSASINAFIFQFGMMTIMLQDMVTILGLLILPTQYASSRENLSITFERSTNGYAHFITAHMKKMLVIPNEEHNNLGSATSPIWFLQLWIVRYFSMFVANVPKSAIAAKCHAKDLTLGEAPCIKLTINRSTWVVLVAIFAIIDDAGAL